jgi:hypothetical protein
MKFSARSGTFLTILIEHKAAYKVARASNQQHFPHISKDNQKEETLAKDNDVTQSKCSACKVY